MICIDDIVFNQQQLDNAVEKGLKNICLCDNSFNLPSVNGMTYMAIGDVRAVIHLDKDKSCNIKFEGFQPTVVYTGGYTGITEQKMNYGSFGSGSYTRYVGSYVNDNNNNNNAGSANSYTASYRTSYNTSYISSGRFCGKYDVNDDVFYANGYGLNLI